MGVIACRATVPCILVLSFFLSSFGAQGAEARKDWRLIAERDLMYMHDTLSAAHPGFLDQGGGAFRDWLERGLRDSLHWAKRVHREAEAQAVLRYYAVGFEDGHLGVFPAEGWSPGQGMSPGWMVDFRQGEYVVSHHLPGISAGAPPIGSRVASCDGVSASAMIARDIAPFFDRRVYLEGTQLLEAGFLTVHFPALTPWRRLAHQCRVVLPSGEKRSYPLRWRKLEALPEVGMVAPPRQAVVNLGEGRYWVHVSTFLPDEEELKDFKRMLDDLRSLRDARLVVLDTRGNVGGNSGLGQRLLSTLFGSEYLAFYSEQSRLAAAYPVLRVSSLVLEYYSDVLVPMTLQQFGAQSVEFTRMQGIRDRLAQALARHEDWMRQSDEIAPERTGNAEPAPRRFSVALVTDAHCASACLDFVDEVKTLPGVAHFGRPTSADTVYMEMARSPLPSGLGKLALPIKVWRQRLRGSNQPHVPDELFDGDVTDTAQVQNWVLARMTARESTQH